MTTAVLTADTTARFKRPISRTHTWFSTVPNVTHCGRRATGSAMHARAIRRFGLAVIPTARFLSSFFNWHRSGTHGANVAAAAADLPALSA